MISHFSTSRAFLGAHHFGQIETPTPVMLTGPEVGTNPSNTLSLHNKGFMRTSFGGTNIAQSHIDSPV